MTRPFGTAAELERRRRQAVESVRQGESPETVARVIGVNRASIYRWLTLARQPDGLAAKPNSGPAPRLSSQQLLRLDDLLRQGAQAHGWPNRLWTCTRIAELIRRQFGVSLHRRPCPTRRAPASFSPCTLTSTGISTSAISTSP